MDVVRTCAGILHVQWICKYSELKHSCDDGHREGCLQATLQPVIMIVFILFMCSNMVSVTAYLTQGRYAEYRGCYLMQVRGRVDLFS